MEIVELIWDDQNKYWVCYGCNAIYRRDKVWEPMANYCMKCRQEWRKEDEA